MTDFSPPICPRCGCPPRYVVATAKVKCIYLDGEIGKIVRLIDEPETVGETVYECGGGHRFTDNIIEGETGEHVKQHWKQLAEEQELPQYTKEQLVEFMEERDPRHDLRSFIGELLTFIRREDLQALCETVPGLLPPTG